MFLLSECIGNVSCIIFHTHPFFALLLSYTIWNPEMKRLPKKLVQVISEFRALKKKYLKGPYTHGEATNDLEKAPFLVSSLLFCACFLPFYSAHGSVPLLLIFMLSSGSWKPKLISTSSEGRTRVEVDFAFLFKTS